MAFYVPLAFNGQFPIDLLTFVLHVAMMIYTKKKLILKLISVWLCDKTRCKNYASPANRLFTRSRKNILFSSAVFQLKAASPILPPPPLLGVKISWKDARRCVIPINTSQKFSQGSSTVEESEICINPSERAFLCRFKPILTYFLRRSLTETGSNWVAGNRSGLWQISNQTFPTGQFLSKEHIIKTSIISTIPMC